LLSQACALHSLSSAVCNRGWRGKDDGECSIQRSIIVRHDRKCLKVCGTLVYI
jgi:hypothetical protein